MSSLIYTPMASRADGAQQQTVSAPAWQLPNLGAVQMACTGNCDQGRRCNCALSSAGFCSDAKAGGVASRLLAWLIA